MTVFLVIYMDGNWRSGGGYAPLTPGQYRVSAPDLLEIQENAIMALDFMKTKADGKFVLGLHTSPYCRDLFYQEPLLSVWKRLVQQGGELAIHPHEEILKRGTLIREKAHMEFIIASKCDELRRAGLEATAFRAGYNAYCDCITTILQAVCVKVDLSCAPGLENPLWDAFWKSAPLSAYCLCLVDHTHVSCGHPLSNVLEIPLGCDGSGNDLAVNYLYNERTDLPQLKAVWDAIVARSKSEEQFVHFLCHLNAIGNGELRTRCGAFLEYAQRNSGVIVTPLEASRLFWQLQKKGTGLTGC